MNKVMIILGSISDYSSVVGMLHIFKSFEVECYLHIASAHRTPSLVDTLIERAEKDECEVIIAVAGMAAHLPGVIASKTLIPVIGIPMPSSVFINGMDALLSIVQMPGGVPVGCMSVGKVGAKNAALYAIQILALNNQRLKERLTLYRVEMEMQVNKDDNEIIENMENL